MRVALAADVRARVQAGQSVEQASTDALGRYENDLVLIGRA